RSGVVMYGTSEVAFGIKKLDDPADTRNRGFWHDDLSAIRFRGAGDSIQIVDGDRTFEAENRLRRGIELTRLHCPERGERLARRVSDLAEVGDWAATETLKLPVEYSAVEFARAVQIVHVNGEMRELIWRCALRFSA